MKLLISFNFTKLYTQAWCFWFLWGEKKSVNSYALETAVISFPRVTLLCLCVQKMFVASPYTDPVIAPDSDPQPLDAGDGLIWVVGPVLAVVFIICIVIAILLYKK